VISIRAQRPIPLEPLQPLIQASLAEGHQFLERLAREYGEGVNTFEKPGEAFFFAYDDEQLVATAGLNQDPFENDPQIGRLRRVYVLPSHRRRGLARQLVQAVLAYNTFPLVHLRSTPDANQLYESLGFQPTGLENPTHKWGVQGGRVSPPWNVGSCPGST